MNVKAETLIRRPPAEVYPLFVEPDHLTKFWLSAASGPLEVGKTVRWDFLVKGASVDSTARELVPGQRIAIDWSDGTQVTWTFAPHAEGTLVTVEHFGCGEDQNPMDRCEGHTWVLADAKLLAETGKSGGMVKDKAQTIEEFYSARKS